MFINFKKLRGGHPGGITKTYRKGFNTFSEKGTAKRRFQRIIRMFSGYVKKTLDIRITLTMKKELHEVAAVRSVIDDLTI